MSNHLFRVHLRNCFIRPFLLTENTVKAYCRLCLLKKVNFSSVSLVKRNLLNLQSCHLYQPKFPNFKFYSMSSANNFNVNYDQLIKLKDQKSVTIIDVREKHELKETGEIPGSYNIPLGEVAQALGQLSDEEFKSRYGFKKPGQDETLVFSCRSGKRSLMAHTDAAKAGYTNILNFSGGWLEWEENTKQK